MPNFFSKYKKLVLSSFLILLISFLGIFVLGAGEAQAIWPFGELIDISFEAIAWIIARIGTIIQSIVSLFLWLAGMLLELAFGIEEFTEAEIVKTGWKITRDITNMFFVLILLIIAFATILRMETYGMKQILWKLIVAALLINFSLVLAGFVIDFTQVLTHFFYDKVSGGTGISAQIAEITNIQKVAELNVDANLPEKIAEGITGVILMIFSIFLGIILILAVAFALGLGAFFLIVRLIILWILLIIAPLAWLLWILPSTSHLFKQWWSSFLKWAFFAPIYIFFIYLAIYTAKAGGFASIIQTQMVVVVEATGFRQTITSALMASPRLLIESIVIIGILFGGLIVAQKMGAYGASGAIGLAKGIGKGTSKWTGKKAQMYAGKPLAEFLQKPVPGLRKMQIPGLRTAAKPFRAFAEKERAAVAESEKKYKGWTSDHLKSQYRASDTRDKAAFTNILAERGDLKADDKLGFREQDIQKAAKTAKKYGQQENVLKARPDLAPLIGEDIEETIAKMKPADMEKLQPDALTPQVQQAIQNQLTQATGKWRSSHLSKMAEVNPKIAVEIEQNTIKPNKGTFRQDIEDYLRSTAGKVILEEAKKTEEKAPQIIPGSKYGSVK